VRRLQKQLEAEQAARVEEQRLASAKVVRMKHTHAGQLATLKGTRRIWASLRTPPPPTFLPLGNIPMVAPAAHLPPPCRSPGLAPPHQRQWVALRPFRIAITRRARARARAAAGEEALEAQARGGREAAEEAAGLARQREAALEDALRAEARETLRCVRPSVRTCHTMAMRWCCPSVSEGPRWLGWRRADGWTEVGWLTLTRAHARPLAARSLAAPPIPPSYRADRRGSRRRSASCACIVRIWLTRRGTPLPGVGAV
jgi:hypothetical protein